MIFLLDTDTLIALCRGWLPHGERKLEALPPRSCAMSVVNYCELRVGVLKGRYRSKETAVVDHLTSLFPVMPLTQEVGDVYGEIRTDLERRGEGIGQLDTLIAAHALSLGLTLVTSNTREFRRVRGLKLEDWSKA